jgi:hypothetical protein
MDDSHSNSSSVDGEGTTQVTSTKTVVIEPGGFAADRFEPATGIGHVIDQKYLLTDHLGSGGMGGSIPLSTSERVGKWR